MSLTRGNLQIQPWKAPNAAPAIPAASTPAQADERLVGDGVGGHRAEDERALQAEIDAPALLGDALAEADEEEGRRDADGAAEDGERHAPEPDAGLLHQRTLPFGPHLGLEDAEAAVERLGKEHDDEEQPLEHEHRRVRQIHAALDQAVRGLDAAEQDREGDDGERVLPRQEGDQDAGIAVAGSERGVGVALDRRHLEHAGKAGESAAERGEADDEALYRQALQQRRADVAAGDAGGETPGGLFDQDPGEDAAEDAGDEAPVHVHARDVADPERLVDRVVEGLFRLAGSRSGPSTSWFMRAMAM